MRVTKRSMLTVLAFLALLWIAAFPVAWFKRVDCDGVNPLACSVAAALRFGGDVVMLKWIDTTLGAGFLALVGGAFVYVIARKQRQDAILDRHAELRSTRLQHLYQLRHLVAALMDSHDQLFQEDGTLRPDRLDPNSLERIHDTVAQINVLVGTILPYATMLAVPFGQLVRRVQKSLLDHNSDGRSPVATAALVHDLTLLSACGYFFEDTERLIADDGTFRMTRVRSVPPLQFDDPLLWQLYSS